MPGTLNPDGARSPNLQARSERQVWSTVQQRSNIGGSKGHVNARPRRRRRPPAPPPEEREQRSHFGLPGDVVSGDIDGGHIEARRSTQAEIVDVVRRDRYSLRGRVRVFAVMGPQFSGAVQGQLDLSSSIHVALAHFGLGMQLRLLAHFGGQRRRVRVPAARPYSKGQERERRHGATHEGSRPAPASSLALLLSAPARVHVSAGWRKSLAKQAMART
jgi:hypothetical protein